MSDTTDQTFEQDVIERSRSVPVLVDFWAEWCGPCRQLTPVLESAVADTGGTVELVKVDVDANPRTALAYQVQSIPAVKAFKDGRLVDEFVGAMSRASVDLFLRALLPSEADRLAALDDGDTERGLDLLLAALAGAPSELRDRIREVMVGVFAQIGQDHPLSREYRRRLAAALY